MTFAELKKISWQQPAAIACLALIGVHLVLLSLFYMEAALDERLAWAALVGSVFGLATWEYHRLPQSVRGLICLGVGLPAALFGLGIHASHVVQVGFALSDVTGLPVGLAGLLLTGLGGTMLVRLARTWWRRLFLIPPGLALLLLVFPVGLGVFAVNVARVPCCSETPADRGIAYEDVTFETPEGLQLSAWFVPSQNGATIITVHGAGKNRATVMDEAEVLARHGYGLLMLDLEGFGNSEGRGNAYGWVGARDVEAAIDYLRSRPDVDPDRIGGLGLSMGGEVLLQAAGESTGLKAVVAEGATGRTARDFREMNELPYDTVGSAILNVAGFTMSMISGEDAPPPLKQLVQQIAPRRVLLIASSLEEETKLMGLYRDLGGPSFELWTIPEDQHVGAFDLHPLEYEQRVVAFFDAALLSESTAGTGVVR